jgi:hypothetical protein
MLATQIEQHAHMFVVETVEHHAPVPAGAYDPRRS